jgi:GLPGLI family protein
MKKKYIILLALILINYSFSQINCGFVKYRVKVIEKNDSQLEKMMLSMNPNFYSIVSELDFELKFNKEKSLFKIMDKLYSDENAAKMAQVKINFIGIILTKNDSLFREGTSLQIGNYVVAKENKMNWVLENETKMIDSYLCYKATSEDIVNNGEGIFKNPIIAWYCPKIPFPFGPLGYGGLPGLVLELQTTNAVYGAKEFLFNPSNFTIENLKRYKVYSEKELDDLFIKKNTTTE